MADLNRRIAIQWGRISLRLLPFADSASNALPLARLLRLSLFQVSTGIVLVLLNGTLNRVMIVELGLSASLVACLISLPVLLAPMRLLLGYRSDHHRSFIGWRRVPYMWFGTMLQFGGLAIMPFALIVMSGDSNGPEFVGPLAATLAFLLVGAGMHTTQTAGLALTSDLAEPEKRHRVVALLYVMLLVGTVVAAIALAWLLAGFSQVRLIQVIQGAAVVTFVLNLVALWKQEARQPALTRPDRVVPTFRETWAEIRADRRCIRLLVVVSLGAAGFGMQDVLLEPYGGEILGLTVAGTTALSALVGVGTLAGFALAARWLDRRGDPIRLASSGILVGVVAFSFVIFAAPLNSANLFRVGAILIGFGSGIFSVGTLTSAMQFVRHGLSGRVLGAWGAAQATALGLAIALSGPLRDITAVLAARGHLGPALRGPESSYLFVYHLELGLLFAALVAIGPMVRLGPAPSNEVQKSFGLSEHPG